MTPPSHVPLKPRSLDIIVPTFNEEEITLQELLKRLRESLREHVRHYRVLLIDDGSAPTYQDVLARLAAEYTEVMVIHLSRNFGHQGALSAGLEVTQAEVVVVMDADLQDRPEMLPTFLEQWRAGAQVVYAVRQQRKEGLCKRSAYYLFYRLLKLMAEIDIPLDAGDFCLMDRQVVQALRQMPEKLRFTRGLRSWVGFRQVGLPVERDARFAGKSKYTLRKLWTLATDGLFSFTVRPLRCIILLGLGMMTLTLCYGGYKLYQKLVNQQPIAGWTSLMLMMILNTSLIVILLGIIGEYLARTYLEVKQRPPFIIAHTTSPTSASLAHPNTSQRKQTPELE